MNYRSLINRYVGLAGGFALVTAIAAGCGSDSKGGGGGGDPDGSTETDGGGDGGGDGSGGSSSGDGGGGDGGTTPGEDGGGSGGTPSTPNDNPDDLIAAICEWEFRCCERGELDFRLGPTTADVETCVERFVFELRQSNASSNPYPSGSPLGLLGQLAYGIDLNRVEVNPEGLGECIAQWKELGCAEEPPATAPRCDGPAGKDPCALDNIFRPRLQQGDLCTIGLAETGARNDIECPVGTTCLAGSHADNPGENAACIQRGVEGNPCTNDSKCDFGFYCSTEDGECHEKGNAGDPCAFEDPDEPLPGQETAPCKPGLTCHPETFTCVEACTTGFVCTTDAQCPEGESCIPLTVGNDTASWKVCAPIGNSASDRCDTHADCVSTHYCSVDGVCLPDVALDSACSPGVHEMCVQGTYCAFDGVVSYTCELLGGPGDPCTSSDGCEPNAKQCITVDIVGSKECSATKIANGQACFVDADCRSGICDYATSTATEMTCIAGAGAGDDCDASIVIGTNPRCGPGLACIEAKCVEQVGPGETCENDAGNASSALCQNASCTDDYWNRTMCTDAPVPKSNGGTGLTCDGNGT